MNEKIRLRTMTLKSVFDDGNYRGWTVEELLKQHPYKIRWMYYNFEKLSFTEEVLNKIPHLDVRIVKPGIDKSQNLRSVYEDRTYTELKNIKMASGINKSGYNQGLEKALKRKKPPKLLYSRSRNVMTPQQLLNKNHGH